MFCSKNALPVASVLAAICLLITSGCASSPPSEGHTGEYQKGAYRPVRPPTFSPTEDAPHTVGQPGHVPGVRVAPQPQPRPTRLLPQTPATAREPGLWSAEEPKASGLDLDTGPVLYGVHLALPRTPLPGGASDKAARSCAVRMKDAISRSGGAAYVSRMKLDPLACVLARLYGSCFQSLWRIVTQASVDAGNTKETAEEVVGKVMFHVAKAWELQACAKATLDKADGHILVTADATMTSRILQGDVP